MGAITHQSSLRLLIRPTLCLLIAVALLAGCNSTPAPTPIPDETPLDAAAATVVSATGVVRPARWANLSMSTAGTNAELLVEEGDVVEAGQPLIRLAGGDPENPTPQLQAAIQAGLLEVEGAQQALAKLSQAAEQARIQAEQALSTLPGQIQNLQYQLEALQIPEDQQGLDPLAAYEKARSDYEEAWDAYLPVKDKTGSETRERRQDWEKAKERYDAAVRRLQLTFSLQAAQANLENARQDVAALEVGPRPDDVALAQRRLDSAQAALAASRAALQDLTLRAPFAGVVSEVLVRPGETVAPGVPLLVLADLSHMVVETTDLNEIDVARIRVGDRATITFDALADVVVKGTVASIALRASPGAGANYRVVLEMATVPDQLRWGMSAFVDILPERR